MADPRAERTFLAVEPDIVRGGHIGEIITSLENRGYRMSAGKLVCPSKDLLRCHYKDLSDKPFFSDLVDYMSSDPVFAMVWEGTGIVNVGREMLAKQLGATNPQAPEPGTIRGDFCIEVGQNASHGSDSVEAAARDIALWFNQDEVQQMEMVSKVITEKNYFQ